MDILDRLLQLQAVDLRLFRTRKELAAKPQELHVARQAVEASKTQLSSAEAALKALQLEQKQKEVDLKAKEEQVRKLQGQLLQLKTNKEYQTMQHEIEALKADNSLLEEAIIKSFDKIEVAAKARAAAQVTVKAAEAELKQQEERVRKETEESEARISQLERDRKTLLPDIDAEALQVYEGLYQRRIGREKGRVMFPVRENTCGACYQSLLPQTLNRLMLRSELVICDCGGCILYLPDEA